MTSMPKLMKLKDYVTITGTTLGILALICATIGDRASLCIGFFFLTLTVATDLMDGYIARKTNTVNELGIQLDSLNDSLTFGIAPAVLTYQAFKTNIFELNIILIIGCVCFSLGAVLRLARFNISEEPGYEGVPTPLTGLMLICFFFGNFFWAYALGGPGQAGMTEPFPFFSSLIISFLMIVVGWFNITTHIHFKEKDKFVYMLFICFAPAVPIFGIIGITEPGFGLSMFASIFFFVMLTIELLYLIRGFFIDVPEETEKNTSATSAH
ncbi:MAG: CDP-alcohol phosphatidyltransferase family protein [Promethearchaeia archaeon]